MQYSSLVLCFKCVRTRTDYYGLELFKGFQRTSAEWGCGRGCGWGGGEEGGNSRRPRLVSVENGNRHPKSQSNGFSSDALRITLPSWLDSETLAQLQRDPRHTRDPLNTWHLVTSYKTSLAFTAFICISISINSSCQFGKVDTEAEESAEWFHDLWKYSTRDWTLPVAIQPATWTHPLNDHHKEIQRDTNFRLYLSRSKRWPEKLPKWVQPQVNIPWKELKPRAQQSWVALAILAIWLPLWPSI